MQKNQIKILSTKVTFSALLTFIFLYLGCSDGDNITNNITNNIQNDTGVIAGRVITDGDVVTVSVWSAQEIANATADPAGYFSIANIKPGVYEVRVNSTAGYYLKVENVVVEPASVTNLGDVQLLNLVWPITRVVPADGSTSVSPFSSIFFESDMEILMSTFDSAISITPSLPGSWSRSNYPEGKYTYWFYPTLDFKMAQEYTFAIGTELKFTSGHILTNDIVTKFTTEKLRVVEFGLAVSNYSVYTTAHPEVASTDPIRLVFNAAVDPDSLAAAINMDYPSQGVWIPDAAYYSGTSYRFFKTGPVPLIAPDSQYSVRILSNVGLGNGLRLERDTVVTFFTYPMMATIIPANGATGVNALTDITVDFNTQMDTSSAGLAFNLSENGGTSVPGTFSWTTGNKLIFNPTPTLTAGQLYRVTISTDANSATGHFLKNEIKSFFVVQ